MNFIEGLTRNFSRTLTLQAFLIAVAVVVLLVGLGWGGLVLLMRRRQHRPATATAAAKSCFDSLCDAHGISYGEKQLMLALSQSLGLEDPSSLFLDPRLWERPQVVTHEQALTLRALAIRILGPELIAESVTC